MAPTTTHVLAIHPHNCWTCGVTYGLNNEFEDRRITDGKTWYCPNGHATVFRDTYKEKAERLKRELADTTRVLRAAEDRNEQLTTDILDKTKELTRVKRRADNGVCQHCKRSFANVADHVRKQHQRVSAAKKKARK